MRVVFLSDDFPPTSFGGAGISTYELALGVKKAGHEVSVITTCRSEQDAGKMEYHSITVFKIVSAYHARWRSWISIHNPAVVRQVENLLRQLAPDVVHLNNVHQYLSYSCLKIAKRHAKVVVWTARDGMAVSYGKIATARYLRNLDPHLTWLDNLRQAGKRYNPLRNFFIRRYLGYVDQKLAVSDALVAVLARNGVKGVETLHTGIDVGAWHVSSAQVSEFKKRNGLESKKIILFGGRLGAGVQVVRAMRLVAGLVPDAVLVVMGREEDAGTMKEVGADLPLVYTGWISGEEKITAYYASDLVWAPSPYFDSFPRSTLEASASGKPVIATKFGGASELVVHGKTGYVVDPLNPQEIADRSVELLQNKQKADAFGKAGRERVEAEFNLSSKVDELVATYRALVAKNS
ncbi:MAG: glycosyltransferase family 4 protein [bacterium]|nr:glycosyltransferase family 4 protein [bacterium]MDO8742393.1 glycosyltransferase family 4 protein [bacterium]